MSANAYNMFISVKHVRTLLQFILPAVLSSFNEAID